jgi:preprotein translocase subunit YajC
MTQMIKTSAREDDEVKILEGLIAHVVAAYEDEVIVETDDGRPKWIKVEKLKLDPSSEDKGRRVWAELPTAA